MATSNNKKNNTIFNHDDTIRINNDGRTATCLVTGTVAPPESMFIMNFESNDQADFQMTKALNQTFMFTSFGNAAIPITLAGFQPEKIVDENGAQVSTQGANDAEYYYRQYNIGSKNRSEMTITTAIASATGSYHGYMVGFRKQPQGEEKINGYAFTIQLICWRND